MASNSSKKKRKKQRMQKAVAMRRMHGAPVAVTGFEEALHERPENVQRIDMGHKRKRRPSSSVHLSKMTTVPQAVIGMVDSAVQATPPQPRGPRTSFIAASAQRRWQRKDRIKKAVAEFGEDFDEIVVGSQLLQTDSVTHS